MRFLTLILVVICAAAKAQEPPAPALKDPIALYGNELRFDVFRKGARIGQYTAAFERRGDVLTVTTQMDLAVKVLFIVGYRFHYRSVESWSGDRLAALDVDVNDDGNKFVIAGRRSGAQIAVTGGRDGPVRAPLNVIPTTHWNPDQPFAAQTLDTLEGVLRDGPADKLGVQKITVAGKTAEAQHFRYLGELKNTEVWYVDGRWVQMRFTSHKDGSAIELRCVRCGV